ncbi:hypothetical protein EVAR_46610_1 [Eumeta japonica]|uniref:Uncharacterized protein n=1 Tax=Eumeta variegata TaxID=151549 RepID=A0A4C1ZAM6_EUMVA|nr:hypothetical protein EVAR_46610_1 [Eumeta japonica]
MKSAATRPHVPHSRWSRYVQKQIAIIGSGTPECGTSAARSRCPLRSRYGVRLASKSGLEPEKSSEGLRMAFKDQDLCDTGTSRQEE